MHGLDGLNLSSLVTDDGFLSVLSWLGSRSGLQKVGEGGEVLDLLWLGLSEDVYHYDCESLI